jgi:hypothetical protein
MFPVLHAKVPAVPAEFFVPAVPGVNTVACEAGFDWAIIPCALPVSLIQ